MANPSDFDGSKKKLPFVRDMMRTELEQEVLLNRQELTQVREMHQNDTQHFLKQQRRQVDEIESLRKAGAGWLLAAFIFFFLWLVTSALFLNEVFGV